MRIMLPSRMAKKIFFLGGKILGDNVDRHLAMLLKSQWYSRAKLEELQWTKFKLLLQHAYDFSPLYRSKFDAYGIKPSSIQNHSDLSRLPILTKNELRDAGNFILAKGGKYKFSIAKSSGSTGQLVKFYKDRNASGNGRAAMYRGHSWYSVDVGAREAKLCGVAHTVRKKIVTAIGDFLLNRFRQKDINTSSKMFLTFALDMRKRNPEYLMGYSSLVYEFARFVESEGIDLTPLELKMVKVTSETLFDYQREVLERIFKCPVVNEYGAAEAGIIAFECPMHGMHVTVEGVLLEEIDVKGQSEIKEFFVTDLNNFYSPIIRYRLGDLGKMSSQACSCGRGLPLIKNIVGRTGDIVYGTDGASAHSSIFSSILKESTSAVSGGVKQYKVYQRVKGELELNIVKDENFSTDIIDTFERKTRDKLGKKLQIQVKFINSIEREKSGKLRYFVSSL